MSELHCPARIVVCADPATPEVAAFLGRERVARIVTAEAEADAVRAMVDDLVDQHRGECVVIVVPPETLSALTDLPRATADRQITLFEVSSDGE